MLVYAHTFHKEVVLRNLLWCAAALDLGQSDIDNLRREVSYVLLIKAIGH